PFRAIGAKRLPFVVKKELDRAADVEIVLHFRACLSQRLRIAMRQFVRPVVPALQLKTGAQCVEEDEVVEPPLILVGEVFIAGATIRRGGVQKVSCRFEKERQFLVESRRVIDRLGSGGKDVELRAVDPTAISEPFQADQERIPGKSRGGRVGRISETEWAQRQHLPYALARRG